MTRQKESDLSERRYQAIRDRKGMCFKLGDEPRLAMKWGRFLARAFRLRSWGARGVDELIALHSHIDDLNKRRGIGEQK